MEKVKHKLKEWLEKHTFVDREGRWWNYNEFFPQTEAFDELMAIVEE